MHISQINTLSAAFLDRNAHAITFLVKVKREPSNFADCQPKEIPVPWKSLLTYWIDDPLLLSQRLLLHHNLKAYLRPCQMFMMSKSSRVNLFCKKCVLKNLGKFIQTRLFWRIFKKETPTRGFSCKLAKLMALWWRFFVPSQIRHWNFKLLYIAPQICYKDH